MSPATTISGLDLPHRRQLPLTTRDHSTMPNSFPIERRDQRSIVAVGVVFSVLAAAAVGMRLVSRRIIRRALDWSDYLIIAACVSRLYQESQNDGKMYSFILQITVISYWATALAGKSRPDSESLDSMPASSIAD